MEHSGLGLSQPSASWAGIGVARLCYVEGVAWQFWQLAFIIATLDFLKPGVYMVKVGCGASLVPFVV